jgi:hypothetical protein
MKRTLVVFVLLATATAFAQDNQNPVTSVVREILPRQQKNIVAAAEEMPADKFGFRPTPEQMTFGNLVLHIIQSNSYLCAKIGEVPEAKTLDTPSARIALAILYKLMIINLLPFASSTTSSNFRRNSQ